MHKHQTQNFRTIRPLGIAPVQKTHTVRTPWYRGQFRRFIKTRFFKYKKGNEQKQQQTVNITTSA